MAHFYGTIRGQARLVASRTGSKSSGIDGHIRGWNTGVLVVGAERDGRDEFDIFATHGSGGSGSAVLLGTVYAENGSLRFEIAYK